MSIEVSLQKPLVNGNIYQSHNDPLEIVIADF